MIIHHWDTDGIASAAIYMNIHGEDRLFTPKIGNYYLDDEDLSEIAREMKIVVLDMNLPDVGKFCKNAEIYIYDHHKAHPVLCAKEHFNPYLRGDTYPSTTTVLMERFSYSPDYLVALGVVGDVGHTAKKIKEWPIISKVLKDENLKFDDLLVASGLLDSSFKLNKREEVMENVYLAKNGIEEILQCERLHRNLEVITVEIEKFVDMAEDRGEYYFLIMQSTHHIISSVTRKLVWEHGKAAIVINKRDDRDEFYIRAPSQDFNAYPIIDMAKSRGYKAGGKREVMGAILPPGEGEKFARKVAEVLGW